MIGAANREGALEAEGARRAREDGFWRSIDRRASLGLKMIAPVMAVTLVGTAIFGYMVADQTRRNIDATNIANAAATARAAAAFDSVIDNPDGLSTRLHDLVADEPGNAGLWIVNLSEPGAPALGSANRVDVGRSDLIGAPELAAARAGRAVTEDTTYQGLAVLLTVLPIAADGHAVVVMTSLQGENDAVAQGVILIAVAGLAVALLEVALLAVILEIGVLRRLRRINAVVSTFGHGDRSEYLAEGDRPPGRDELFNLAREVDLKLHELDHRERAGAVVGDLGMYSVQGATPAELANRALVLTLEAADLDRCLFVEKGGRAVSLSTREGVPRPSTEIELPVWMTALARSASHARKPVLAGRLGQDARLWDGRADTGGAAAAFVPISGLTASTAVMIGLAHGGDHIHGNTVSLLEGVATALSESVERREALRARQESADKSRALSTLSHEMRNPLNAMLGFSELLLSGSAGPLTAKQHQFVEQVDEASHHLLRLVNDYLDFSRVAAGALSLQVEPVPVGPIVSSVLELMGPMAQLGHVSLHSSVEADAVALADRTRLRQVLVNLVTNAIRSTPARGHVRVEVAGGSNGVRLSVIDTGTGVPADRQDQVFVEFAELHPGAPASDGAGLGLALSKHFVEAMGGFIRFTSSEGAGSIFDVWLPGENSPHPV